MEKKQQKTHQIPLTWAGGERKKKSVFPKTEALHPTTNRSIWFGLSKFYLGNVCPSIN